MVIYVVVAHGPIILGAYTRPMTAELHARCITGAVAVACDLLEYLDPAIREDLYHDWQSDSDTPVTDMEDFDPKEEA